MKSDIESCDGQMFLGDGDLSMAMMYSVILEVQKCFQLIADVQQMQTGISTASLKGPSDLRDDINRDKRELIERADRIYLALTGDHVDTTRKSFPKKKRRKKS